MKTEDVKRAADNAGILWDYDPVFMMISKGLTGKSHLSEMNERDLETMLAEIKNNPAAFTKKTDAASDGFFFKQNHDYDESNFVNRVRIRNERYKK
tara:strand:- start:1949 stop:2236 length:288 start_codon:yes stop_codon:yes gene_type:complete